MMRIRLLPLVVSAVSFSAGIVPAQNVESLALPDPFDSRPVAARLAARIAELNREAALQTTLGNPAAAANIAAVVANLQAWQSGAAAIPPAASAEVHAVSFYEGAPPAAAGLPRTARIQLTRSGNPVILLLNAYESITWTLDPLPAGVAIAQIVLLSYDPQVINGVPAGVPVTLIDQNGGGTWYGSPGDLEGRVDVAAQCLTRFGSLPVTFTGSYTAPAAALEVGPGSTAWRDQWVLWAAIAQGQALNSGTFASLIAAYAGQLFYPLLTPAMQSFGSSALVAASPVGVLTPPIVNVGSVTNYAIGAGPAVYVLQNRVPSTFDPGTLTATAIPPNPALPAFSWVCGLAHDPLRNRVIVSTFGGAGTLYAYDAGAAAWSVLAGLNNADLGAIVYHPALDALFALDTGVFGGGPFLLRRYDANGAPVATFTLGLSTWGGAIDNFQMYVLGTNLALVGPAKSLLGTRVRHAFVIDPASADIVFAGFLVG